METIRAPRASQRAAESFRLLPIENLPFDDEAGEQPVPDDVATALTDRPLDIFRGGRRATVEELCGALRRRTELAMPDEFSTMLTAQEVVNIAEADNSQHCEPDRERPGESYRPPWVDTVFRPRPASVPIARNLRAADGGIVRPLRVDERVFGRDDRKLFAPRGYPWHCIGHVSVLNKSSQVVSGGTATLVGRRTIVTAAHIVPDDFGGAWFTAAKFGGTGLNDRSLLGLNARSWVTEARGYFTHEVGNDIMVMRLLDPLGDWLGYLGFATYDDDWEDMPRWTHVGYPTALSPIPFVRGGQFPYRQEQIAVYDDDNGPNDSLELQHYGDAGRGDSGGPLFGWFGLPMLGIPYDAKVVGVMSGNYQQSGSFLGWGDYDHNVHAGGNALTRLCWYGRNNWD